MPSPAPDPTQRFSNRVADYIRYRPHYPERVISFIREELGLRPEHPVADIGSGTGILSELFLRNGNTVFGVEPNREMREAGESLLAGYPNFRSIDGTAEATTLPDASVDFITAGQAFHWFRPAETRREFGRILRPGGYVLLIWNSRRIDSSPFLRAYEELLRTHGTDYEQVAHRAVGASDERVLGEFFAPDGYRLETIPDHFQQFDFEGLKGRMLSSSYMPPADDPRSGPVVRALREIFDRYQDDGTVRFEYDTEIYYGRLR